MVAPTTWATGKPEPLALPTKYELDPFQKHAVLGIHAGDHVFVTAKTGSGKTFVGEYLIAYWLARGKRVFYTTPIKSLSNQKYHDLKKLFPDATVGILTGDIKMCPQAQVVVMTAEILRNLLYKRGTATEGVGVTAAVSLDDVAGIVMDEVHYIQDPDRGHVWEETLILAAKNLTTPLQLVLLSATLPSASSLAGWLAELHQRRTWLLSTTYRIVPLVHGVLEPTAAGWKVTPVLDTQGRWINDAYSGWLRARKAVADAAAAHKRAVAARGSGPVPSGKVRVEDPVARLLRTVRWLDETAQMPALFFVFSRRDCERYAALMVGSLLDSSDAAAAGHIIDFHLSRHRATLEQSPQYHQIRGFLVRGIAFHHSGLQPLLKEIVEILFTRGLVKVLFATETFSVGLNMPTKTVVFLALEKWTDGSAGKRLLRPDEYIQMAGRAGRRGLDTQGLVLYEPMDHPVDASELKGLLTGALPPLHSRMRFHYDFILKRSLSGGTRVAEESYWAVEQRATRDALGKEMEALGSRVATMAALFAPGQEALLRERAALEYELSQSVNAKRKKAQAALNLWMSEHDTKELQMKMKHYEELSGMRRELAQLEESVAKWDATPLLCLEPQEACLRDWGFLASDVITTLGDPASEATKLTTHGDPASEATKLTTLGLTASEATKLTTLGLTASETNEGHPILMPLLAASGHMDTLTAEEIACVLAAFLQEGRDADHDHDHDLGPAATAALTWIGKQARACQVTEDTHGVHSPSGFWNLTSLWVCVTSRWLSGAGLTHIAQEFGIFEGNVQRGLLRVASILEEWGAIATLRRDLATLEKLAALSFLRNEVVVDSLYLRI